MVQDVLVRAHGRWRRIAAMEHPAAYLKKMIVNEYLPWRRRSRRQLPVEAGRGRGVGLDSGTHP